MRTAHKVTKPPEVVTRLSASADKSHKGEATAQDAADRGLQEWRGPWLATEEDCSEHVLREIETIGHVMNKYDEIVLPPITDEEVHRGARSFHGRTAVSSCCLRPRHILLLSRGAEGALGRLLMFVESSGSGGGLEAHGRWCESG